VPRFTTDDWPKAQPYVEELAHATEAERAAQRVLAVLEYERGMHDVAISIAKEKVAKTKTERIEAEAMLGRIINEMVGANVPLDEEAD
jgi:uncharacterized protein YdeI (YjbR/CyaY-like superfamily)